MHYYALYVYDETKDNPLDSDIFDGLIACVKIEVIFV
jgi:hypothetical protein